MICGYISMHTPPTGVSHQQLKLWVSSIIQLFDNWHMHNCQFWTFLWHFYIYFLFKPPQFTTWLFLNARECLGLWSAFYDSLFYMLQITLITHKLAYYAQVYYFSFKLMKMNEGIISYWKFWRRKTPISLWVSVVWLRAKYSLSECKSTMASIVYQPTNKF